ncbi:MAG: low-specificity L-threonine aldolase [Limibacillus sp.]|jgi:threonine aldolase
MADAYPINDPAARQRPNAPGRVDLRSDTVTQPSAGMRRAMLEAELGDDVYRDDPTVRALEEKSARMLGKESALFCTSGTQTNLLALLTHCGRGEEYLVGEGCHTFGYEGGGAMALGGVCAHPLPTPDNGQVPLERFAAAVRPYDVHYAKTRLISLENTYWGRVLPLGYQAAAAALARDKGLALHLDGARMMNAAVKLGEAPDRVTEGFDTVSLCLSKGLGAPVGSVLAGPGDFIERARHWRKMLGGGMRQAGVLAAAGLYALDNNIERMADDHARARRLAEALAELPGLSVDLETVETNMLFLDLSLELAEGLLAHMAEQNIVISGPSTRLRLVTHLDVDDAGVERVIEAAASYLAR